MINQTITDMVELSDHELDAVVGGSAISFNVTSAQALVGSGGAGGFSQSNSTTSAGVNGNTNNGGVSFGASSPALSGTTPTIILSGS